MSQSHTPLHKNKIAIIGNPNVGKSSLFNKITKSYSLVSNFPYTTLTVSRATITIGVNSFEVIDTPGILSLDVQSEDGLVTRNILIEEHPELIILCLDTNNLKRSLILACQILEMEIPTIVCLNIVDESLQKGISIKSEKLERLLGVPVVKTVATEGRGIKELIKKIQNARVPERKVKYTALIEQALIEITGYFPSDNFPPVGILLLLLQKDNEIENFVTSHYGKEISQKIEAAAERVEQLSGRPASRVVFEERNRWAEKVTKDISEIHSPLTGSAGEIIGILARHPFFGWIILLGIIYVTYLLVGKVGAGIIAAFFDQKIFIPATNAIGAMIPWDFWREFAVGEYGILTTGLANALGTVLPILAMFFLILNFLEDIGYIPNLCVLSNRLFQRVGLSGKAILPIVLGFGCKTMATLATKILDSKKERYIAIFLIAFAIPCSSQLGINVAILALFPFRAFLIVFGVLTLVEIIAGLTLNKILKEDRFTDFILELPPIRFPNIKSLLTKTYYRLKWFLYEAVPLFIIGSVVLFLMDRFYILDLIKRFVFPLIVSFLDLPIKTVDAFLLCFARHEAGAVILMDLVVTKQLDYTQTIVSIIIVTCFVPCFANIMAMIKELGIKSALVMVLVIIVFSVIIGGIVNYILRIF